MGRAVREKLLYNRKGYLRLPKQFKTVMAGLDPASTDPSPLPEDVDGRVEHGHDEAWLWL
jgi:hypothetical protein